MEGLSRRLNEIVSIRRAALVERHSLSEPLGNHWSAYKKLVRTARSDASIETVHRLRVATQKLEAVLKIAKGFGKENFCKSLTRSLRRTRKTLGKLRNLQVETIAIARMRKQRHEGESLKKFCRFIEKQKSGATDGVFRALQKIRLREQQHQVRQIARHLCVVEKSQNQEQIAKMIGKGLKKTSENFDHALKQLSPFRVSSLHRFRMVAKQLRYQKKVRQAVSGTSDPDLIRLKDIQAEIGEIQDNDVLRKSIDRYLNKKTQGNEFTLKKIRSDIEAMQVASLPVEIKRLTSANWLI